ncbi:MAG TPA: GNAT family N-acetyltransferase, partial [Nitrososphaerales archaeon]
MDVPLGKRQDLEGILEESFEGWYLRASKGTLRDIDVVRAAMSDGKPVGLVMLKTLEENVGYVYYIAVARAHRRSGVAKLLLEDSLRRFVAADMKEAYASVEEDNEPSVKLFASEGFKP